MSETNAEPELEEQAEPRGPKKPRYVEIRGELVDRALLPSLAAVSTLFLTCLVGYSLYRGGVDVEGLLLFCFLLGSTAAAATVSRNVVHGMTQEDYEIRHHQSSRESHFDSAIDMALMVAIWVNLVVLLSKGGHKFARTHRPSRRVQAAQSRSNVVRRYVRGKNTGPQDGMVEELVFEPPTSPFPNSRNGEPETPGHDSRTAPST